MLILQYLLNFFSRLILKKYQPKIIGITGSVGKTSTKAAILAVLQNKFRVRGSIKNYNNELGVPLTIIGKESAGKNIFLWTKVFLTALGLVLKKDSTYPEILVLEMGADKPGDIRYLTQLAPCQVGVLTAIGPTHLEKFKTLKKVAEEKQIIIKHLSASGFAVINYDDELVKEVQEKTKGQIISFGFNDGADLQASDLKIIQELENGLLALKGESFKLTYHGSVVPVVLNGIIGQPAVYAALAGAAVGLVLGMNLVDILEALKRIVYPLSRMSILSGIKYTTLIDDSYNASPRAMELALEVFKDVQVEPGSRKIAVLGDMLELGSYTEEAHKKIGELLKEAGIDFLVTVGERAKIIAERAEECGYENNQIVKFSKSEDAGLFLQEKLIIGDTVLIKGSQGVRMDKIVVELMAEPLQAEKLVCRQDKTWQNK
ncbi:MAG TPA: UDP-N-acetylmuramoyl-tripeptide--D-alanyl-D-alanine ligase [Candidatus Magasanikbacteria bacterium]|nr:UDP-N-acetylmuramoyl-tripeptide--D-alanyl-D-alanine ligase [Candidatus Magasanikbacteria bacterium]